MVARSLDSLIAVGELTPEEARLALGGKKKRSKYGAVRCELDGFHFDSRREMQHYAELARLQLAGEIEGLFVHPTYPIKLGAADVHVCNVEMDFTYRDKRSGKTHVVDVKGKDNPLSKLKRKLLEATYNFKVEIV